MRETCGYRPPWTPLSFYRKPTKRSSLNIAQRDGSRSAFTPSRRSMCGASRGEATTAIKPPLASFAAQDPLRLVISASCEQRRDRAGWPTARRLGLVVGVCAWPSHPVRQTLARTRGKRRGGSSSLAERRSGGCPWSLQRQIPIDLDFCRKTRAGITGMSGKIPVEKSQRAQPGTVVKT